MAGELTTSDGSGNANIVYILYLAGVFVPLTPLIGVIMAYLAYDEAEPWVQSHYKFQIRTFWIGLLFGFVVLILCMVVIGFLLIPVVLVWYIVRCVKGLNAISKRAPMSDPGSWLFG